jgi:predicted nucleic acid-binding protein
VLAGSVRRALVTEEDALGMLDDARAILGGRVATVSGPEVLRIALQRGLTAYDAEFVVLAQALDVPLVTADRAILNGAPEVAVQL